MYDEVKNFKVITMLIEKGKEPLDQNFTFIYYIQNLKRYSLK